MVWRIFYFLCFLVSSSYAIEYSNSTSLHGDNYKAHWKFDNETEMFYFKVEVNTTGWVAFGVSRLLFPANPDLQWNLHAMEYYDVIVGGMFPNKTAYYKVSVHIFLISLSLQSLSWYMVVTILHVFIFFF